LDLLIIAPSVSGQSVKANRRLPAGRRLHSLIALILLTACSAAEGPAQHDSGLEYKFKAAYLYNFLQFIEWPETAFATKSSPVVIGIFSQDPLARELGQLVEGESINGRKIIVQNYRTTRNIKECNVIFIPGSQEGQIGTILSALDDLSVLTVSEVEGFAQNGGAINFYVQDNKLRFEINPDVLKKVNLKASSRLLRLARIVEPAGRGG